MKDWDGVQEELATGTGQIEPVAWQKFNPQTNPSGKLPMSIERFQDSPAYGYISDSTHFMCDDEFYEYDLSTTGGSMT